MNNKISSLLLAIVVSSYALAGMSCGPAEPTCEECLSEQEQGLPAEDGCSPYCDGEPREEPPQVTPYGTYDGYIILTGWDGPDTSRCEYTPLGFAIPLYVVVQGQDVRERIYPCQEPSGTSDAYSVVCINHAIDQVCDPATDPRCDPAHPDYYYERRDFQLTFTRDARRVTGTLTDARNWGGCSVRRWAVDFEQRPLP